LNWALESCGSLRSAREVLEILSIRCAVDGRYSPAAFQALTPQSARPAPTEWKAYKLVLALATEQRNLGAIVHGIGHLIWHVFDRAVQLALRQRGRSLDRPESSFEFLTALEWSPWRQEYAGRCMEGLGLRLVDLETTLLCGLGVNLELLYRIYSRRELVLAALFVLAEATGSAQACLMAASSGGADREATDRIRRATLTRGRRRGELEIFLSSQSWGGATGVDKSEVDLLRDLPDVAVVSGSPPWVVSHALPRVSTVMLREGRRREYVNAKRLLTNPTLGARMAQWQLMRGDEADGFVGLVRWIVSQLTELSREQWDHALETVCRTLVEAGHVRVAGQSS
jgi:hypothetical protein